MKTFTLATAALLLFLGFSTTANAEAVLLPSGGANRVNHIGATVQPLTGNFFGNTNNGDVAKPGVTMTTADQAKQFNELSYTGPQDTRGTTRFTCDGVRHCYDPDAEPRTE